MSSIIKEMEESGVKNVAVIGVMMVVLLATNPVQAAACEIVNGSFEDDGKQIDFPPGPNEPNGWDVNIPDYSKFKGSIDSNWPTDCNYNSTLYSEWIVPFDANDMATISQKVNLTDANKIIFDVNLDTYTHTAWDPMICTAILKIDNDTVWESNSVGSDVRDEYFNQSYVIEDKYRDGELHTLSFGIRINVKTDGFWERYFTNWDFIECRGFCGDGGLLAGDFNRDCYVDFNDLNYIAQLWLDEEVEPENQCNLFRDDDSEGDGGTVTFRDFAVFSNNWDGYIADLAGLAEKWLQQVEIDDEHNLFTGDDINSRGNINFLDFSVFAKDWWQSSYIEDSNDP